MSGRSVRVATKQVPKKAWFGGQLIAQLEEIGILGQNRQENRETMFATMSDAFAQIGASFSFAPFANILQPMIGEVLVEQGQDGYRKGTILTPKLSVWLVLALSLRRDLNYYKVLDWMIAGFRWIQRLLPPKSHVVQEGAISHARVRLGVGLFRSLFYKLTTSLWPIEPDFHDYVSAAFDGSTGTMPDTEGNVNEFHKPKSRSGQGAFPQMRMMTLMALSVRLMLDVAYAPYAGKGTGERSLVREILSRLLYKGLLFLLDAGLYSFDIVWELDQSDQKFIAKTPKSLKPKPIETLPDGSYLAQLTQKIEDPDAPPTKNGRKRWQKISMIVRVIRLQIPGFRPVTLVTNILDTAITARELAIHYHKRWDIEIAYDEIKTHQCATLRGQSPTTFRSKRPDLVEQELYALLITYNAVRLLIRQAAEEHGKDPCLISFLDALQHIINAAPLMTADKPERWQDKFSYLLALIADCDIDRPRRHRINPRVVKVKMSKFKRKNKTHKSEKRNLEKELKIIWGFLGTAMSAEGVPA
jgi:hypothetical protein